MNKLTTGTKVGTEVEGNIITSTSVSKSLKKRNWFLTINNYNQQEIDMLNNIDCKYIIWQKEIGEECKTPHIHATIIFKNAVVWPKRHFPRADIEVVKKLDSAIKYCSKLETRVEGPFERGERPQQQGTRNDLKKLAMEVIDGKKLNTIANEQPDMYIKYGKGLKLLREEIQPNRDKDIGVIVLWLWGNAGVGKTYLPNSLFTEDEIYIKDGTQWWDNYDHEKCIIIDDFDGKWPYRDFLRLLDRYKYQGQYKGGYTKINSRFIIITCEFPPSHFWDKGNQLNQVTRRLKGVYNITPETYTDVYWKVHALVNEH